MTLNYSAKITVDAKDKTTAIYDSVNADNEFYPENPVKTKIKLNQKLVISVETDQITHLRANLNSTLRLIQASYDSIQSVRYNPMKFVNRHVFSTNATMAPRTNYEITAISTKFTIYCYSKTTP